MKAMFLVKIDIEYSSVHHQNLRKVFCISLFHYAHMFQCNLRVDANTPTSNSIRCTAKPLQLGKAVLRAVSHCLDGFSKAMCEKNVACDSSYDQVLMPYHYRYHVK